MYNCTSLVPSLPDLFSVEKIGETGDEATIVHGSFSVFSGPIDFCCTKALRDTCPYGPLVTTSHIVSSVNSFSLTL